MNRNTVAAELYTTYCAAVGGVNFNGDPLPTWDEFSTDEGKAKQVNAWLAMADAALEPVKSLLNALCPLTVLIPTLMDAINLDMDTSFQVSRVNDPEVLYDVTLAQLIDNARKAIEQTSES